MDAALDRRGLSRRPRGGPRNAVRGYVDLRGASEGPYLTSPGCRRPRQLQRRRKRPDSGPPDEAGRHGGGVPAGAGLHQRPLPGRQGADQLLGLSDHRLFRSRPALSFGWPDRRGKGHGRRLSFSGDRSDPGRGLQPHRRGGPTGPDVVLPGAGQCQLLPSGAEPALLCQRHRHRQHAEHGPPRWFCGL